MKSAARRSDETEMYLGFGSSGGGTSGFLAGSLWASTASLSRRFTINGYGSSALLSFLFLVHENRKLVISFQHNREDRRYLLGLFGFGRFCGTSTLLGSSSIGHLFDWFETRVE